MAAPTRAQAERRRRDKLSFTSTAHRISQRLRVESKETVRSLVPLLPPAPLAPSLIDPGCGSPRSCSPRR